MLLNKFFHIMDKKMESGALTVQVRLNPDHEIYKAHFPARPITPGVCQIQMITEILALHLHCELCLTGAKNVKYMTVISPVEVTELTVKFLKMECEGDACKVSVVFFKEEQVFSKMSVIYHVVRNHSNI